MGTAQGRYEALQGDRNWYLDRARECARLTLPYLVPSSNDPGSDTKDVHVLPWNGIGARGVLNLASRMLLALLPPTESFFRFVIPEEKKAELEVQPEMLPEIEKALARMEREVLQSIEASNDRVALHEALLWLIVAGNVLLYVGQDELRVLHLNRYVIARDPMGNPTDMVVCEEVSFHLLPQAVKEMLDAEDGGPAATADPLGGPINPDDRKVKVYTYVEWHHDRETVTWHQEVKGKQVEGSRGTAPFESSPWLPLRMSSIAGQAYGVSYVESAALADLATAESLSQALAEGSLAIAKLLFLVRPGSTTKAKTLADARNGAFVPGDPNDVAALQGQKVQDLSVAANTLARIEARLSQAFMLADVRDSERTTAEEVRLQALQIENSLGSIYSILSQEFQAPYISRKLDLLTRAKKLPQMPDGMVRPVVSVGLAAVGRQNDLEKWVRFSQVLAQTLGPESVQQFIKPNEYVKRVATAMSLDTLGLVKTDQEIAQERAAAQDMQMRLAAMRSAAADPQRQAQAAAIEQETAMQAEAQQAPPPSEP